MLVPVSIREVMTSSVRTVPPDHSLLDVAALLHEERIGSVVVVRDGDPVGILTESDMVRVLAEEQDAASLTAHDCMSAPLITVDTSDSISEAVERFKEHSIKKLPVLEDEVLVGILTTTDLSYYIPHLTHRTDAPGTTDVHERTQQRPDTAYEDPEWEFESHGRRDDHIDVGDIVRFTKTLDEEDVTCFADASGDTNRLHLDDEYAASTRFGHKIVHGTLVSGTISAALARLPGLIIYLSQDVSYLGPVDIGEHVTAACEVVEDIGNNRYRLTTAVLNEAGERLIDGEAVVLADDIPDV
jgi:CBS domain-containing protein/acyl dehydratase